MGGAGWMTPKIHYCLLVSCIAATAGSYSYSFYASRNILLVHKLKERKDHCWHSKHPNLIMMASLLFSFPKNEKATHYYYRQQG
jgi:hypothetical protein